MTTSRLAASLFLRASRLRTPMAPRRLRVPGKVIYGSAPGAVRITQSRFYSQEDGRSKNYSFADVKNAIEKPDPNRIIIDVREPGELQSTGRIPTAVNIPISSQPDSFFITAEEFEDRYGFDRPDTDKEVIFYCKAGVRSRAAAELARQAGWNNVGEYPGSWLDWEKNGGETQRDS